MLKNFLVIIGSLESRSLQLSNIVIGLKSPLLKSSHHDYFLIGHESHPLRVVIT
jgi:hypothetical protein